MRHNRPSASIWFCFVFATLLCSAGCDMQNVVQQIGANQVESSSDDEIRAMFEQANQACPRRMDMFTMLDEIEVIDASNIEFRYSVNPQGERLLRGVDTATLKQNAVSVMKGNPMAVAVAERDLTIHHVYKNKSGSQVLAYTVNKESLAGNFETDRSVASDSMTRSDFGVNPVSNPAGRDASNGRETGLPSSSKGKRGPSGIQTNPFL